LFIILPYHSEDCILLSGFKEPLQVQYFKILKIFMLSSRLT